MGIPEDQLETWSRSGAQKGSADTYNSIKAALESHKWPSVMGNYSVYLQGSYPNHTNIRGDSDVDVVVETPDTFYHNVPEEQRAYYGLTTPGSFRWFEFRDEVRQALMNYYAPSAITQGNKCIKVAGNGGRLNADVIPCNEYRNYTNINAHAKGITFWAGSGTQIVNYPKLHLTNGSAKNQSCGNNYKPNIRVFKNARNRADNDFPSYFLECLLYNVPDSYFTSSSSTTFHNVLNYLYQASNGNQLPSFICQNGQQYMFGTNAHQTSIGAAHSFINALVNLWNNW